MALTKNIGLGNHPSEIALGHQHTEFESQSLKYSLPFAKKLIAPKLHPMWERIKKSTAPESHTQITNCFIAPLASPLIGEVIEGYKAAQIKTASLVAELSYELLKLTAIFNDPESEQLGNIKELIMSSNLNTTLAQLVKEATNSKWIASDNNPEKQSTKDQETIYLVKPRNKKNTFEKVWLIEDKEYCEIGEIYRPTDWENNKLVCVTSGKQTFRLLITNGENLPPTFNPSSLASLPPSLDWETYNSSRNKGLQYLKRVVSGLAKTDFKLTNNEAEILLSTLFDEHPEKHQITNILHTPDPAPTTSN